MMGYYDTERHGDSVFFSDFVSPFMPRLCDTVLAHHGLIPDGFVTGSSSSRNEHCKDENGLTSSAS